MYETIGIHQIEDFFWLSVASGNHATESKNLNAPTKLQDEIESQ